MPNYLSPEKARRLPLGITLPSSDLSLVDLIGEAQALIDAYCQLPLMPSPSGFLGGTGIVEEHRWRFPEGPLDYKPQRRVYPYHWPVRAITDFKIEVGAGSRATIPTDALVINNTEKWIEITALSIANASGLFGVTGWVVPIGGLSQPKAIITIDCGWDIAETGDVLYALDNTNKVFVGAFEHWIQDITAPVVYVDGVPTLATIDYLLGTATFASAKTGRVTADYRHKLPREIPTAMGYVVARLQAEADLRAKDMEGLESIKDDTIEITRPRMRSAPKIDEGWLEREVPAAAQLLGGFKSWRIG